jgi:uncharacterized protein (TIGR01732 family)
VLLVRPFVGFSPNFKPTGVRPHLSAVFAYDELHFFEGGNSMGFFGFGEGSFAFILVLFILLVIISCACEREC